MQHPTSMKRVLLACMIGNALEWYDFALYGFFVGLIGRLFFPSDDPLVSIIAGYGAFAAAFLLRPVGAIVLGAIGDKYGRKPALLLALYLMAIPTTLIGFLPTYATAGIIAPILLTTLRLLQGFSVGGELTGSMIFIAEHSDGKHRGFLTSFVPCSTYIGMLAGSSIAYYTHATLTPELMAQWGWRIPFLLSIIGVGVGIYIRRRVTETETFERIKKAAEHTPQLPIVRLLSRYWKTMLLTIMVLCGLAVCVFFMITLFTTVLTEIYHVPMHTALLLNTINMVLCVITIPFFGWLSDIIKREWIILSASIGMMLMAYPVFQAFEQGLVATALASITMTLCYAAATGALPLFFVNLYHPSVRYSGLSLAYNIGMSLFGGTAPWVGTTLLKHSGNLTLSALYLVGATMITCIGVVLTMRHKAE